MQLSIIFGDVERQPRPDYAPRSYEDRAVVTGTTIKRQPPPPPYGISVVREIDIGRGVLCVGFGRCARHADIGVIG
jgi:hypothetical protein